MVMNNPKISEAGVSELIGSILMIAVLVMAVSIAGVYLFSQPRPEKIPSLHATIWNDTQKIYLSHDGGDPLDYNYIKIYVDGIDKTSSFFMSTATGQPWTTWSIGNVLVYVTGSSPVSIIQVVYTGTGSSAVGLATLYVGPGAGGGVAPDPVTASFSGSPTSGFVPFGVQFTDASTGLLVSWLWSFGDGGISTEQNPLHTYSTPSTFTVSLTVSNGSGGSIQTRTNYIAGYLPIIADFTGTPRSGAAPLPVTFTDTSTNTPTSWKWEYRNAITGWTVFNTTSPNPSFTFPTGIYSINLTASNAGGSDNETKNNYITVNPSPPWYSCSWGYRKNITIYKNSVNGAHTSFPVLINLTTDNDLKTSARTDGFDILFTSSDGTTKLNHEIESYNSGNGALLAWVNVPFVNSSYNNTIYMYYGYPTATDQQNKNGVWDTNYRGVWHLKEDPAGAAMMDSTSYGNHGTSAGTMTTSDQVAGKIDGSLDFDGSNDLVNCGQDASLNLRSAVTMEAWINASVYNAQFNDLMSKLNYDTYISKGKLCAYFITNAGTYDACPAGGQTMVVGTWYHVAVTYNAGSIITYINGAQDGTASKGATINDDSGYNFNIGYHDAANGLYWQGRADEARLSSVARSADWIRTEYNNQNSPSTFHYVMVQEQWSC